MKFLFNPIKRMTVPELDDVLITQLFGNDPVVDRDTWYGNKLVRKGEHVYQVLAGQKGHNGIDIMAERGKPIYAPADGWIIEQVNKDTGLGLRISIRHDVNNEFFFTTYGHMQRLELDKPISWNFQNKLYPVKTGQVIGYVNSTGYSTGDHLHWSLYPVDSTGRKLYPSNGYGGAVDPFDYSFKQDPPMNQTKIVLSKDGKTVYKAIPVATDFESFKKQASVEGIVVPNPIPPASDL